ncbi:MAG: SLC13 family permease [Fidelibacterota bacterium]
MIANVIYWITERRWLLIAVGVAAFLYVLPTPTGLTVPGYRTIIIVVAALILIIFEPVPLPTVAMLILVFQVIFGVASADRVASSFMSDAVFFIMGSLMLAVAVVQQGLDKRLALGIIKLTGHKTWKIVLGFIAVCAVLASFIGEHTVTAMMMPVGLTLVKFTSKDPRKVPGLTALILFSIAYGSILGSIGTPSGGGRNVIMIDYLSRFGLGKISYLSWMKYAYPMLLVEIPLATGLLWWTFRPERKVLDSAVRRLKVQVARGGGISARQGTAIGTMVLIFLGWVFLSSRIGLGIVALIGVILYLSLGLVEWGDLNRRTNWGVILLFGAAISIGVEVKETGAALWLANGIVEGLQWLTADVSFLRALVSVLLPASLANVLSSAPAVAVIGPIVLNMGGDPMILGIAATIASDFAYLTVVAAPPCMIIYASGLVEPKDFLRAGWKMFVMSVIVLAAISQVWWPFLR